MSTDLGSKSSEKFHCIICDYYTSRKSQLVRHNLTDKHKNQQLSTFVNGKVPESSNTFTCECGKKYRDRSGLWRHVKKCPEIINKLNKLLGLNIEVIEDETVRINRSLNSHRFQTATKIFAPKWDLMLKELCADQAAYV